MNKEDKQLLLKDLYGRSPYGVKCCVRNNHKLCGNLVGIVGENIYIFSSGCSTFNISVIIPYLFPLSSMTEEQKEEYYSLADDVTIKPIPGRLGMRIHCIKLGISDNPHEEVWDYVDLDAIDWLNKNHFDYRGLIKKGLAIDATGLNIY